MEIVFWAAVVYLTVQSGLKTNAGLGKTLGWVVAGIGGTMSGSAMYASAIAYIDWRFFKHNGVKREQLDGDAEKAVVERQESQGLIASRSSPGSSWLWLAGLSCSEVRGYTPIRCPRGLGL